MHKAADLQTTNEPPTPESLQDILSELSRVMESEGILNAELWREAEPPQERPGRLELPRTETIFVRIERVVTNSEVTTTFRNDLHGAK